MYITEPVTGNFTWFTITMILSVIGGILIYIFFLSSKKEIKLSLPLKWLKEFLNFDKFIIEVILKIGYLISTLFIILFSLRFIAYDFGIFFLTFVLGIVFVRIIYELILIVVSIWKNTSAINKKIK